MESVNLSLWLPRVKVIIRRNFPIVQLVIFKLIQIFDNGRVYSAIEQLNELYQQSENLIERLQRAVRLRRLHQENTVRYVTS